ncbi:MAG TPA: PqqD family protein [Alphaproteobacteria bacterium]
MGCCLIYTPSNPNLYTLNATAWLILELCDGRSGEEIAAGFASIVRESTGQVGESSIFVSGLEDLMAKGIVTRTQTRMPPAGGEICSQGDVR